MRTLQPIQTNLLKSKITLKGYTMKEFSEKIGLNKINFYLKLNNKNKTGFFLNEVKKIVDVLELDNNEVVEIFLN